MSIAEAEGTVVTVELVAHRDFDAFYRAHFRGLVAQVYALVGDLGEAEEVVQEAFSRAWPRWKTIGAYDKPDVWVRTVAFRAAVSRRRRITTATRFLSRQGRPEDSPEPSPDSVALVRALRTLPAAQRTALVLHHMAGLSLNEIAEAESVPVGTIKARLSRGRTALSALLEEPHDA